ncbi:MAG: hypothetical protein NVSMB5_09910 [Candidatus Velthaea sp.]
MKFPLAVLLGLTLFAGSAAATPAQTGVLAHKGAEVDGELQQRLDSGKNHDGDTFTLVPKDTFFHKNPALKGATIEGHLESVTAASHTHKATMNVIFDDVKMPDGTVAAISASVKSFKEFEPKTHHVRDAALIVGGAVAGRMVSKKVGHGGGTLAGAAAGFALASSMKSNIVIKQGTLVRLKMNQDVVPGA